MSKEKDYNVTFNVKEVDIFLIQLSARVDYFKNEQVKAGKNGDIKRVIEIEEGIKPLLSGIKKLENERYK